MEGFQLTTRQIASLKALHRTLRDRKQAYRVNAIVLLGTNWSVAHVAEALLVDEKTVRLWHEKYVHGGENELIAFCYQGKTASLTEMQQEELAKHLDEKTRAKETADCRSQTERIALSAVHTKVIRFGVLQIGKYKFFN